MSSDTPKTDAECYTVITRAPGVQRLKKNVNGPDVSAYFARQLERELTAAQEENGRLRAELEAANNAHRLAIRNEMEQRERANKAEAELDAAKKMHESAHRQMEDGYRRIAVLESELAALKERRCGNCGVPEWRPAVEIETTIGWCNRVSRCIKPGWFCADWQASKKGGA